MSYAGHAKEYPPTTSLVRAEARKQDDQLEVVWPWTENLDRLIIQRVKHNFIFFIVQTEKTKEYQVG